MTFFYGGKTQIAKEQKFMNSFIFKVIRIYKQIIEWICKRLPHNAIIAAIIFLLVVIGLVLFMKYVFPVLLVTMILVGAFFGHIIINAKIAQYNASQQRINNVDFICWELTKFIFSAISNVSEALKAFVFMPNSPHDISDRFNYRGVYNGATILKLRLLRKPKDISKADMAFIKNVLQSAIDTRLLEGFLDGYGWIPLADDIPLVKIAVIGVSPLYIDISVLLTIDHASIHAARLSDNPPVPPSTDDSDPLF